MSVLPFRLTTLVALLDTSTHIGSCVCSYQEPVMPLNFRALSLRIFVTQNLVLTQVLL